MAKVLVKGRFFQSGRYVIKDGIVTNLKEWRQAKMKRALVMIGGILLIVGVIEFLIEYYQVLSLMNVTGIVLLVFGCFVLFVGVLSSEITKDDYAVISGTPDQKTGQKQAAQSSVSKPASERNCPKCGRQVSSDAHLCPYCGYDLLECR